MTVYIWIVSESLCWKGGVKYIRGVISTRSSSYIIRNSIRNRWTYYYQIHGKEKQVFELSVYTKLTKVVFMQDFEKCFDPEGE